MGMAKTARQEVAMAEPSVKAAPQLAQVRVARMVWMEMAARVAATLVEADLAWEVDMAMGMRTVAGAMATQGATMDEAS